MDAVEVKDELESLGVEGFVHAYGKFFLVLTEPEALDAMAGFVNTASREAHDFGSGRRLDGVDIRPLVPRQKGADRITVGREDADVELPHRKVSKQHAYFRVSGGLLSLADAGSKNGTWLNGAQLGANEQRPVDVGDTVNFGSLAATIWGIDDLLAAVRA